MVWHGLAWFGRVQVPAALVVQFLQVILPSHVWSSFLKNVGWTNQNSQRMIISTYIKSENIHKWLYMLKMGFMMTTPGHGSAMFYTDSFHAQRRTTTDSKTSSRLSCSPKSVHHCSWGSPVPLSRYPPPPLKCSPETGKNNKVWWIWSRRNY